MLRISTIGLLLSYLVSFTEFKEVLRLPMLVQHYSEHKEQVTEMSFFEFLSMHYKTDVAHDDHDNQLPFKNCTHSFIGQIVMLPIQKMTLVERVETNSTNYQFFYLQHEPKLISAEIFQPPKI